MSLNSNPSWKTQPIVVFLNLKTPNYLASTFSLTWRNPNLNLVDDAPSLDIIPWKIPVPAVQFDLASFKKDTTNPEIHKQLCLQLISEYPLSEKNLHQRF